MTENRFQRFYNSRKKKKHSNILAKNRGHKLQENGRNNHQKVKMEGIFSKTF